MPLVSLSDSMSALALVLVLDSMFHRLALVLVLALGSMLEESVLPLLDPMWATLAQLLAAKSVELLAAQLVVAWLATEW